MSIILSGCGKNEMTSTYDAVETSESLDYQMAMGFNLADNEGFTYVGDSVEVSYYIDNQGSEFEMGVYLFVDGIIQEYDAVDYEGYLYTVTAPAETTTDVSLSFEPTFGMSDEQHYVRLVYVLNPETVPTSDTFDFKHDTSVNSPFSRTLDIQEDIGEEESYESLGSISEMTDEDLDYFDLLESDGSTSEKILSANFVLESDNGSEGKLEVSDGELSLTIYGMGGTDTEDYNIYFFLNAEPVFTDSSPFRMTLNGGENLTQHKLRLIYMN